MRLVPAAPQRRRAASPRGGRGDALTGAAGAFQAPTTFVTVGEGAASPPGLAAMTQAATVLPGVRPV